MATKPKPKAQAPATRARKARTAATKPAAPERDESQVDLEEIVGSPHSSDGIDIDVTADVFSDTDDTLPPATLRSVQSFAHSVIEPPIHLKTIWDKIGVATMDAQAVRNMSAAELVQAIVRAEQTANAWRVWQGFLAHAGRELHGRGAMTKAAEDAGVSRRSLYNYVDLYQICTRSPQNALEVLLELDTTKILAMKALPDDSLAKVVSGEPIAGITLQEAKEQNGSDFAHWVQLATLSAEEKAELEALRDQKQRLVDDLASRDMELETARAELKAAGYERYKQAINNASPDYLEIREESYVTADLILAGLNNLRRLFDAKLGLHANLFEPPPNPRVPFGDQEQVNCRQSAAATLYHNLAAAVSPALTLLLEIEANYEEFISDSAVHYRYSKLELEEFSKKRNLLLAADEAARKQRAATRHNELTRGQRGRPRKVES